MAQFNTSLIINGLTSDTQVFSVKTGTTDLVSLQSNGNFKIGNSDSNEILNIFKTGFNQANIVVESDSHTSNLILNSFKNSQGTSGGSHLTFKSGGVTKGDFYINSAGAIMGIDNFQPGGAIQLFNNSYERIYLGSNLILLGNNTAWTMAADVANGRVGIGTNSPLAKTEVRDANLSTLAISNNTTNRGTLFLTPDATSNLGISSYFNDKLVLGRFNVAGSANGIGIVLESTSGDFTINSDYSSGPSSTDFIYQRSSRNIGLGIVNPIEKLHISGGTIRINTVNGTEGAGKLMVSDANGSISFSSTTALGLGGVNGTGTVGTLAKWSDSTTLTNSLLSESGTGVTVNGSVQIYGNVDILGTATTFNTQTIQTADNNITLNLSGSHVSALYGGITVLSGKTDNTSSTWAIDSNGGWSANSYGIFTGLRADSAGNTLVTYNSAGTNTFSVRDDGNVGIGITPTIPDSKLEVKVATNQRFNFRNVSVPTLGNTLVLQNINDLGTDVTNVVALGLDWYHASRNNLFSNIANIIVPTAKVHIIGNNSSSDLFALKVDNSVSSPLLYVRNDGNVGIGMTEGTHKLNVNGNIGLSGISNTYNIGVYEVLKISQGSGALNISIGNNNTLVDADNGGGIVIGSSSLAASDGIAIGLSASATTGTVDAIVIGRGATASNSSIRGIAIGRDASVTASNAFAIGNYTTASQDDTIILGNNSIGNQPKVGIGTSTPTAKLDISGATGYNQFRMRTSFTPTGTTDGAGNTGDLAWDADYIYIKSAAGWKRSGLATW